MSIQYEVQIVPSDDSEVLDYRDITSITLIDANSHGQAALGGALSDGESRLLVCSPNVLAVRITRQ